MTLLGFTNWYDEKYTRIKDDAAWAWYALFRHRQKAVHEYARLGSLMAEVMDIQKEEANGRDMSYCEWAWVANEGEEVLPCE